MVILAVMPPTATRLVPEVQPTYYIDRLEYWTETFAWKTGDKERNTPIGSVKNGIGCGLFLTGDHYMAVKDKNVQ